VGGVLGVMGRRGWCRFWGYRAGRVLGRRALPGLGRCCGCWVWGVVECCVVSSLVSNLPTCTIYRNTKVSVTDMPSCRSYLLIARSTNICVFNVKKQTIRSMRRAGKVILVLVVLEVYVVGAKRIV
jgi:hypothetical protein